MTTTYTAHFTAEEWQRDNAVEVDPQGPTTWDVTAEVTESLIPYLTTCAARRGDAFDDGTGVLDNDDVLDRLAPNTPDWIREWDGPFTIRVTATTA